MQGVSCQVLRALASTLKTHQHKRALQAPFFMAVVNAQCVTTEIFFAAARARSKALGPLAKVTAIRR